MLKSDSLKPALRFLTMRRSFTVLCVFAALVTLLPPAFGQGFTLSAAPFVPFAVSPGFPASSTVTVTATTSNASVTLSCAVSSQAQGTPPTCFVSPETVSPSATASVTVTTTGTTTPALYTITVTGTSSSGTASSSQNLTVLAVSPQFTITVQTTVAPSSVHAGSGGQGTISVNPINGYVSPTLPDGTGGVTLSCTSITPLVTIPPVCSFNPPAVVVNGTAATSTLTITTQGPTITEDARKRTFYALWLPLPMLMLSAVGFVAGGKRSRKAWGLLALFVVSGAILLMPACGNTNVQTTTPNGVTPNNTYTFTVTGVDVDGNTSSNTSNNSAASVTLTVD